MLLFIEEEVDSLGRVFVGNSVYDASRVQIKCGLQGAVMLLMLGDEQGSIKLSNGATVPFDEK